MKKIKQTKGITMITLIVTILVMLIIAGVTINQSVKNIEARKIDSLYADLELLEDKVNMYYLNNGSLPIKEEFKGSDNFKAVRNVNDNNVYYVIDISKLEGVSLSMKLDFTGDDVYIMNEQSHTVYYPKGLTIDSETYYMLPKQYSKIEDKNNTEEGSTTEPIEINFSGFIAIVLEGRDDINAGMFTNELKDENNNGIAQATNDSDGSINFNSIVFEQPGIYQYTISQIIGNSEGIIYDDSIYYIIIRITEEKGRLVSNVKYYDEERTRSGYSII